MCILKIHFHCIITQFLKQKETILKKYRNQILLIKLPQSSKGVFVTVGSALWLHSVTNSTNWVLIKFVVDYYWNYNRIKCWIAWTIRMITKPVEQIDTESLAIVLVVQMFFSYRYERGRCILITDHKPLIQNVNIQYIFLTEHWKWQRKYITMKIKLENTV